MSTYTDAKKRYYQKNRERILERMRPYSKKYYHAHKDYYKAYSREWQRRHRLSNPETYGSLTGDKRAYPEDGKCHICERAPHYHMDYHHFDDNDLSLGIWVCKSCHKRIHNAMRKGIPNHLTL